MKIGAFGEVMLRLTPPEYLLLEQSNQLRMEFTGTGVNLLSNLSHFGQETALLTMVPDNRLGEAALANLRRLGIATDFIGQAGDHLGSFFAEIGYGTRPTQVTYQNRRNSAFSLADTEDYLLADFVAQMDLIHICGISLSLTEQTVATALTLAEMAHGARKKVCFDFNFRPSLNDEPGQKAEMKQRYEAILPYCDLVFGSVRDLVELLHFGEAPADEAAETALIQDFMKQYGLQWFAGTKRERQDEPGIIGRLYTPEQEIKSVWHKLSVLDRIGAGDAYAAGILLGYGAGWDLQRTCEFATGNAVLAHTIQGDVPLTSRKMVEHYLQHPEVDLLR